jgi:predicted AAA+ superfamily ATPase
MMEKYRRPITYELQNRLDEPVRRLIVVAGPRQVGKTTAVHQVLESRRGPIESYRFFAVDASSDVPDLLDFSVNTSPVAFTQFQGDGMWLVTQWRSAREAGWKWHHHQRANVSAQVFIEGKQPAPLPYVLVFDEIQKIPDWSSIVKGLWDEDRRQNVPMHVVVLGSAPLLMQHGLSESLMGRFELLQMSHWFYSEMHDCFGFSLDQYVYFGGYPGPADMVLKGDESRWRDEVIGSLIAPNLKKDVLALARIEKPAVLEQLFKLGCQYSGQIVAVSKLLVRLEDAGNTTTLSHFLSLLQAAGLLV